MYTFDSRFKIGTKVRLVIDGPWYTVKEIHPTRKWIKLNEVEGSFQVGHISKFTNKELKKQGGIKFTYF